MQYKTIYHWELALSYKQYHDNFDRKVAIAEDFVLWVRLRWIGRERFDKPVPIRLCEEAFALAHKKNRPRSSGFVVGAAGFEPAISWSQTWRLNRGPRPAS